VQRRTAPDGATYVGKGKLEEIREAAAALDADVVIFDTELTPAQLRNLRDILDIPVVDRTAVILDIFARRALTDEGKIQVELAQLRYRLTRLSGKGVELSRLGGGIGTRGPGETKLETDRRHIMRRIGRLRKRLSEMETRRTHHRERRKANLATVAAIVGYTNAGKSTLLNALAGSDAPVADQLFMTLDPTARRMKNADEEIILIDTVGFIRDMPQYLSEAFRATLEEVLAADFIIVVADATDPDVEMQITVVEEQLRLLSADDRPLILVANKIDLADRTAVSHLYRFAKNRFDDFVEVSAADGSGITELKVHLSELTARGHLRINLHIPFSRGDLVDHLERCGILDCVEYDSDGIHLSGRIARQFARPFYPLISQGELSQ
jgi:GTP-binding protein HflX